jgi:galactokinase
VPLELGDWKLATLDSGAERSHAESGYNERREECRLACRELGLASLRDASERDPERLPEPLGRRVRHVVTENRRVQQAAAALEGGDLHELGRLLDASHASLRDDYEVSVSEVERAVVACRRAGAAGARVVGGGFGGAVLALYPSGTRLPRGAVTVAPGPPARLL